MNRWLAVLFALPLWASGAMASGMGVFGSYMDAGDAGAGYGGGVKLELDISDIVSFQASTAYLSNFDTDEDVALINEDLIIVPVEGALLLNAPMGKEASLYAGGGVGYYVLPEFERDSPLPGSPASLQPDVDLDDTVGWFATGGIRIQISDQVSLFAEGKYVWLEVDGAEVDNAEVDLNDEIDLTGLGANAGLIAEW